MEFKGTKLKLELFADCQLNEYNFYRQAINNLNNESILFANAYGKTEEEALANATLIAAAPDLLEALILISNQIPQLEYINGWDSKKERKVLEVLRKALTIK